MKALKTAVTVIGVAAAVVATAGLLAPVAVGAALGSIGLSLATVSAIATAASIAGGILTAVSKPPGATVNGSQTQWKADPQAGIPLAFGRTFSAGNIVKRETYGPDNIWQLFTTVYSMGPIAGLDQFYADRSAINFDGGGNAIGTLASWMYLYKQHGADDPNAEAMYGGQGAVPGPPSTWTANHKLSGLAASNLLLRFDKKEGKVFAGGVPQPGFVLRGLPCYDPRKDSTYPGGIGAHRWDDQSTWEYSERPALVALSWAIGFKHQGKRRAGIGFHINSIDVASFVAWANVCDANGWTLGGVVTTRDEKWNVLKLMCQAGAAEPLQLGGHLSVTYSAPRVSVATITSADLQGTATAAASQPQRERINTVIPRIRSEAHGWEVISLEPVKDDGYIAQDEGSRTEELDLPLVQEKDQASELAAYKIGNARELSPIDLPLAIRWAGLRPGLAVTLSIPELNLNGQKALAISRGFNPANGAVSIQCKTETDGKHDWALGRVAVAPPTPELTGPAVDFSAPLASDWVVQSIALANGDAGSLPALRVLGTVMRPTVESVIIEYRLLGEVEWQQWGTFNSTATIVDITGLVPGEEYEVAISYVIRGFTTAKTIYTPDATGSYTGAPTSWPDVTDPLGTKPEDNATVGAPPGTPVGNMLAEDVSAGVIQLTADMAAADLAIAEAEADIADLFGVYGDTASAAASAAAAAGYASTSQTARDQSVAARTAAEAAEDNAIAQASLSSDWATVSAGHASTASTKASEASGSATAAAASATTANTKAGEASTSASNAASSASTASGHSSSASTSASTAAASYTAARDAASAAFPSTFGSEDARRFFTEALVANPNNTPELNNTVNSTFLFTSDGSGPFVRITSTLGYVHIRPRKLVANMAGRRIRLAFRARRASMVPAGASIYTAVYGQDATFQALAYSSDVATAQYNVPGAEVNKTPADTAWYDFAVDSVLNGNPQAPWVMPGFYLFNPTTPGQNGPWDIQYLRIEDVTAQIAAETSASAAATSASSAASSSSGAAQSASAAASSATTANTASGNASTYAGQASSSATTAAGHASTAATQATLSATSYTNAIRLVGNEQFDAALGLAGWSESLGGAPINPVCFITNAWDGSTYLFNPAGRQQTIFSTKRYQIDPNRKYKLTARYGAYLDGVDNEADAAFYLGFVGLDPAGNVVDHGGFGSYRYALALGQGLFDGQLVQRSVIVTGSGNDSWTKFPPLTSQVALMAIMNYNQSPLGTYIGELSFEDVTAKEEAAASASVSASSAATASSHAAAAAQSVTLSARMNINAINPSPTFADNVAANGAPPTYWDGDYLYSQGITHALPSQLTIGRVPYHTVPAGQAAAYFMTAVPAYQIRQGGWAVIEADILLHAGSLYGSGLFLTQAGVVEIGRYDFSVIPDLSGVAQGAGQARKYSFRKLIQLPGSLQERSTFYLYAMTKWQGFGSWVDDAKVMEWQRCAIRPATQMEIDSGRITTIEANVSTNASTLASLNGSYASLSSTVSTQGSTITSHATSISTLSGNVSTLFARAGVRLDVNGYMVGWETNNNGQTGNFIINADYFSIVKPGGGARTEFSSGNWRVYDINGTLRVRLGVW